MTKLYIMCKTVQDKIHFFFQVCLCWWGPFCSLPLISSHKHLGKISDRFTIFTIQRTRFGSDASRTSYSIIILGLTNCICLVVQQKLLNFVYFRDSVQERPPHLFSALSLPWLTFQAGICSFPHMRRKFFDPHLFSERIVKVM